MQKKINYYNNSCTRNIITTISSPIGSDRTDIELMVNQCHCGEAYADDMALKRHIKHAQEIGCGTTGLSPGVQKCAKTNSLSGSISERSTKITTCITVLSKIVSGARMRYQCSPNTLERYIKETGFRCSGSCTCMSKM